MNQKQIWDNPRKKYIYDEKMSFLKSVDSAVFTEISLISENDTAREKQTKF